MFVKIVGTVTKENRHYIRFGWKDTHNQKEVLKSPKRVHVKIFKDLPNCVMA